jgi:hypothetical protein
MIFLIQGKSGVLLARCEGERAIEVGEKKIQELQEADKKIIQQLDPYNDNGRSCSMLLDSTLA